MSLSIMALFRTNQRPQCPRCASIVYRAVGARNGWERFLSPLLMPFRCDLCGHHFFLAVWRLQPEPAEETSV